MERFGAGRSVERTRGTESSRELIGGIVTFLLGVDAERKSLEAGDAGRAEKEGTSGRS